jgi:hypothetical protein
MKANALFYVKFQILGIMIEVNKMRLVNLTYRLFKRTEVDGFVKMLQSNDPEWTYKAVHDPTGKGCSFIEIYDEENCCIGRVC